MPADAQRAVRLRDGQIAGVEEPIGVVHEGVIQGARQ